MLPRLFGKSRHPIGIDVGAHTVRMLQLEGPIDALAVSAASSYALDPALPPDGPERDQQIETAIRTMLDEGKFDGKEAVSCLQATDIQYKNLRVPKMPPDELKAAVEWEANDRFQFTKERMALQYFDAGEVRQGDEMREEIILLAAPNIVVDRHVAILQNCSLRPVAIDAVPSAMARALCWHDVSRPEAPVRVFLDMAHASTKVVMARHGQVVFFKLIEIGAQHIDEAAARHLNLSPEDAAELRQRLGRMQGENGVDASPKREGVERAMHEACQPLVTDLARELGLCLRYYSVTFRGRRPEVIEVTGGGSGDAVLMRELANAAELSLEPVAPFAGIDLSRAPELDSPDAAPRWAVALGLALRQVRRTATKGAA